ncbi:hypothetical protein E1293_14450 [Actinomadura darangshiensis]|uniref:Uncharacterized protein n=1 Tax=Actinomadura darangshiensis TaxID=705336 RepID=A0A4R5BFH0_9ACTN|nr:hypothetical protein [Actinomadura darangshiensis]TDD83616.1 hypothetical protein E1293_14450 [Actinomadura darangshiensis]
MGFNLQGLLTVDPEALALYERLLPGGSAWAVPVTGEGLPDAWVLPEPTHLADGLGNALTLPPDWYDDGADAAWRAAAGAPDASAPLPSLDLTDMRFASLFSLAAPAGVVYMGDTTFGGTLDTEYAAVCVDGRLRAASGIEHGKPGDEDPGSAFVLRDGSYATVPPDSVSPIADCAAVLDPRYRGSFLFDGYLPRSLHPDTPQPPGEPYPKPLILDEAVLAEWSRYFPILRG